MAEAGQGETSDIRLLVLRQRQTTLLDPLPIRLMESKANEGSAHPSYIAGSEFVLCR